MYKYKYKLRRTSDLALRATKETARTIGPALGAAEREQPQPCTSSSYRENQRQSVASCAPPQRDRGQQRPKKPRPSGTKPDLRVVSSDNKAVVVNHQGGLRSCPLYKLAHQILVWSRDKSLSLRAVYIPGHLNVGADILSRQGPRPGEWRLHPEVVKQIWRVFG